MPTRHLAAAATVATLALAGAAPAAFARHGADDRPGDDRGGQVELRHGADDPVTHDRNDDRRVARAARHRADDRRARHHHRRHHGRHGADDGPNHR
jgi:hypothetical protein